MICGHIGMFLAGLQKSEKLRRHWPGSLIENWIGVSESCAGRFSYK